MQQIIHIKSLFKSTSLYKFLRLTKYKTINYFDKKRRTSGNHQYTIISAVYQVEKYLDDYFNSLVTQTLKFNDHIHLIMVDDGSIDNSAQIIKRWQKKYPDNITYIKKKNGGQASARNLGINYVKTEWVTFIDPDDFLDKNYFDFINNFLIENKTKDINLIACNQIFYFEEGNIFKDTHPLNYRFKKENTLFKINDNLNGYIQLSASLALFHTQIIKDNDIQFDPLIKPKFEDAHFVNRYLLSLEKGYVGFLANAKYYYRKRKIKNSTLDISWELLSHYDDLLLYGYLNLLKISQKMNGEIPKYIQRTVLYDLMYHFRRIVDKPEKLDFLTSVQQEKYRLLLQQTFTYIDTETILSFNLARCRFFYKVGFLSLYKNMDPPYQIVYIDAYSVKQGILQLRYYYHKTCFPIFKIDNNIVSPKKEPLEYIEHKFLDDLFVKEMRVFLMVPYGSKILIVDFEKQVTRLSFKGKQYKNGFYFKKSLTLGNILIF